MKIADGMDVWLEEHKEAFICSAFLKPAFDLEGFAILRSLSSSELSTNSMNGRPLC